MNLVDDSRMVTLKPLALQAIPVVRPAIPAPTMRTSSLIGGAFDPMVVGCYVNFSCLLRWIKSVLKRLDESWISGNE